jgi:hypothetical protein
VKELTITINRGGLPMNTTNATLAKTHQIERKLPLLGQCPRFHVDTLCLSLQEDARWLSIYREHDTVLPCMLWTGVRPPRAQLLRMTGTGPLQAKPEYFWWGQYRWTHPFS